MRIGGDIRRIDALDRARIEDHIARGVPVIITGAVEEWPIYRRWTREALLDAVGTAEVEFRLSPTNVHPAISPSGELLQLENQKGSLGDYLQRMSQGPNVFLDANLVCLVSRRGKVNRDLAPLLADVVLPHFINELDVDTIGLWLSGKDVKTRLHYDRNGRNNFNAQLAGEKSCLLIPPGEFSKVYPFPMISSIYNFTRVNNYEPDLEAFPLYSEVVGYQGTLGKGDLLFIPAFWYHSLTHLGEFNFNLNFWCDAANMTLTAVALRNELATILQASVLTSGGSANDARWIDLARQIERYCLDWSPRRATSDEIKALSAPP